MTRNEFIATTSAHILAAMTATFVARPSAAVVCSIELADALEAAGVAPWPPLPSQMCGFVADLWPTCILWRGHTTPHRDSEGYEFGAAAPPPSP